MPGVLALDSGAARMGWANVDRVDGKPVYYSSGILHLPGDGKKTQEYRIELVNEVAHSASALLDLTTPDYVVNEIIPSVGGGNFAAAGQSYLANTAVTVFQAVAVMKGYRVVQIAANSVQARIAVGRRGRKTTKVQVRNGVFQLLPELEDRKKAWVKIFDEPDAIAVGLAELGFRNGS
jgi:Holliday junction resolvasome RuvABC endonuclease subunit